MIGYRIHTLEQLMAEARNGKSVYSHRRGRQPAAWVISEQAHQVYYLLKYGLFRYIPKERKPRKQLPDFCSASTHQRYSGTEMIEKFAEVTWGIGHWSYTGRFIAWVMGMAYVYTYRGTSFVPPEFIKAIKEN